MEVDAIRGIRWTLLAFLANRVVSLATTFVLARLLVPEDFGLVAFAWLLAVGLGHLTSLGLGPAIVVRQDLDREGLATAHWLLLVGNVGAGLVLAALAPAVAAVIDEPRAVGVTLALAVPVAASGTVNFHSALLRRDLMLEREFRCRALQVLAMSAVSITAAAAGAGVWSLVAGQAASLLVGAAALAWVAPVRVRPRLDRGHARSLIGTGRGFMLQGGVSFAEQNLDYAVIGAALGPRTLGLYSMSYRLSELPNTAIVDSVAQATFPGFARMRSRGEDPVPAFLTMVGVLSAVALPLGLVMSGAAEPLVEALLGPKWEPMIPLLAILGLWGTLRTLQATIGWFVNAMELSWHIGRAYLAMLALSAPILVAAAHYEGAEAVAWVMVGNVVVMTGIVAAIAARRAGVPLGAMVAAVRVPALGAASAWAATRAMAEADPGPPAVSLVMAAGAGVLVHLLVLRLAAPGLISRVLIQMRRAVGPAAAEPATPV